MSKHVKDMDFGEIMEVLDRFQKSGEDKGWGRVGPFDSWEHFYEVHGDGHTREEGIHEQWMGGMHEFTFVWRGDEEFPFAYVFPKREEEDGYYFYIKQNEEVL